MNTRGSDPRAAEGWDEVQDDRTPFERLRDWFNNDSPSWLASLLIHMTLLIIVGIFFGHAIVKQIIGETPRFEAPRTPEEPPIEVFDMANASVETSELTTDSLTNKGAGEQQQQEAAYFDDKDKFEDQGGGNKAGMTDAAGGLGLKLKAEGLGPVLGGNGGAEMGKGEGTDWGHGGAGSGFGGRGQGHREALLGRFGGTKTTEKAVAGALNWLARHQNANGSWSVGDYQKACKGCTCSGGGTVKADSGGTALGLLPFLAAGQTHQQAKGPYYKQISKAINWLLSIQKPDGDLCNGAEFSMYSHGLASIALCEAYGMTNDSRVGHAARQAVAFIQEAQNDEGGWRYTPRTPDADTSVLGWQMMAMKSAIMAGIAVDPGKIEKGRRWLEKVSNTREAGAAGMYSYRVGSPPTPCMSSVALLILQYTGSQRDDPTLAGGVKYLMANMPANDERDTYYWYYGTQVLHNMCGPEWDTWNRRMRRLLVEAQCKSGCASGSWDPSKPTEDRWSATGGRLMMTSLSALTLEVYYRYLPLYKLDKDEPQPAAKGDAGKPAAKDAPAKKPAAEEK